MMICCVDYKESTGLVRDWLLVKYQVLNDCFSGMKMDIYHGKHEITYGYGCPGSGLFFSDSNFEIMKAVGYFVGSNGKYLGEGGAEITDKTEIELNMEREHFEKTAKQLLEKGYKLFATNNEINYELYYSVKHFDRQLYQSGSEWESDVNNWERYLIRIFGLYLIPEKEVSDLPKGTLLVSSVDGKEIIYSDDLDLKIRDGFSKYGIRLMPQYVDEKLIGDRK